MRLFIALPVPSPVQASIYGQLSPLRSEPLRSGCSGFLWVRQENLHITILFLGERENQEIPELREALTGACSVFPRFQITCRGLGFFPPKGSPRVLYVSIDEGADKIGLLYRSISLNPHFETNDSSDRFHPHITAARIKKKFDRSAFFLSSGKQWNGIIHGTFTADRIVLYRSDLYRDGARYTAEAEIFLGETGRHR